ncbi:MAG: hypothetical protein ACRELF_27820, partial [Gemmataceae bacterium]
MPPRKGLAPLYYRCRGTASRRSRRALELRRGNVFSTEAWFNAFFESYWREHTTLNRPRLRVRLSGAGTVRMYRRNHRDGQRLLQEASFTDSDREVTIEVPPPPPGSAGLLFFEIEARSARLMVRRALWLTDTERAG